MSFDYISRVEAQNSALLCSSDFDKHATSLSAQLSLINSSVTRLSLLLEQVGGRRDNDALRADIQALLKETREKFKATGEDVKKIQRWSVGKLSRSQQYTSSNLSSTFTALLTRFQSFQRVVAEITLRCPSSTSSIRAASEAPAMDPQQQSTYQSSIADQNEVEFQQTLIQQREQEMVSLQEGIEDINILLNTLAIVVNVQGDELATIEENVYQAARDIREASVFPVIRKINHRGIINHRKAYSDRELRHASRLHKRARHRACCLLLTCTILLAVALFAIMIT